MKRLTCLVTVGEFEFKSVHEVTVKSSNENLTDTATVAVPRKLKWQGKDIAGGEGLFKRGDAVSIKLGYDYDNKQIFTGFVSKIMPGTPLVFECEDAAWKLKQTEAKTGGKWPSYKSVSLRKLLTDVCPLPFETVDAELGQFKISNATVAQVLKELADTYSLPAWCRDGKLFVGLAYRGEGKTVRFRFGRNVIDGDRLEYNDAKDIKVKVKAISMLPNNQKIEVELGDADGQSRTLHYYNKSEAELRRIAGEEIKKLQFDGYSGSFEAFGEPMVRHGDVVELTDPFNKRPVGKYLVKAVETTFGQSGFRQSIEIDQRVS